MLMNHRTVSGYQKPIACEMMFFLYASLFAYARMSFSLRCDFPSNPKPYDRLWANFNATLPTLSVGKSSVLFLFPVKREKLSTCSVEHHINAFHSLNTIVSLVFVINVYGSCDSLSSPRSIHLKKKKNRIEKKKGKNSIKARIALDVIVNRLIHSNLFKTVSFFCIYKKIVSCFDCSIL